MTTICLNMIVKDEAAVIGRCLDSVVPFIDRWVIVDTGSTDGTQSHVRSRLASIPGELHERPWKDFAHNRNEALALARNAGDYIFFIDADERLDVPPAFERAHLDADAYHLDCEYAGTTYARCALVAARLDWRWQGVVHEFLTCDGAFVLESLAGPRIVVSHDGARSRDPQTYLKDAELLEQAIREKPDSARDVFYLAQSYRDAGEWRKSREAYLRRGAMGGWDEEVWYSLYQAALLDERLGASPADISASYQRAFQQRPARAEPLVQLARFHRLRGEHALAYLFARHAASLPRPRDILFVEESAYTWRALDELSIAAYYAGHLDEGRAAVERLIAEERFPPHERQRILANRSFYR